jgi:hypothetical protein
MQNTLIFFLVVLALYYIASPILVRAATWMNPNPRIEPVWPEYLPPEIGYYLRGAAESLTADGFAPVAHFRIAEMVPNVEALITLCINAATRDKAMAAVMVGQSGGQTRLTARYVEFSTRYADGTILDTNNTSELSSFRPVPEKKTFQLPRVQDPRMLYRVHQALMERFAPGKTKVLPSESDMAVYLRRVFEEDFERQAAMGLLKLSTFDGRYRMTWKGAFVMTWGLLWPMKPLRIAARDRQAAGLLRSLNVAPPAVAPASRPPAARY